MIHYKFSNKLLQKRVYETDNIRTARNFSRIYGGYFIKISGENVWLVYI